MRSWTDPNSPFTDVEYYYDTNPFAGGFSQNAAGRLAAVATYSGGNARRMFSYTNAGLITAKRQQVGHYGGWITQNATWAYNNEGQVTTVVYPTDGVNGVSTYTYGYDGLGRPNQLSDSRGVLINGVQWGAAGELRQMTYDPNGLNPWTQTRLYNALYQLTQITGAGGLLPALNLEYRFSATENNGRITSYKDHVTGEDVAYAYDDLQRLISAITEGPEWGLTFTYDGFGNLTQKTPVKGNPSPPGFSAAVDPATNRLVGMLYSYDLNGNLTSGGADYDRYNRYSPSAPSWNPDVGRVTTVYAYGADNKRLMERTEGLTRTKKVYFYDHDGRLMTTLAVTGQNWSLPWYGNVYFAGLLVKTAEGNAQRWVATDRLGSVRVTSNNERLNYYPYGEEMGSTANGRHKFATYFREANNANLDYADQRYYANNQGRFLTPDPYHGSAGPANPESWNRYAYVENDPVDFYDPSGLALFPALWGGPGDFTGPSTTFKAQYSTGLEGGIGIGFVGGAWDIGVGIAIGPLLKDLAVPEIVFIPSIAINFPLTLADVAAGFNPSAIPVCPYPRFLPLQS